MKRVFYWLSFTLYWKIFYRLYLIARKHPRYNYHCKFINNLSKIKDIKTNILTKEQKIETDKFYKKYYGKKISYSFHNMIVGYNNFFDVKYISPDIFWKFIDKLNRQDSSGFIFYDKNFLYNFSERAKIKTPKRFFYSTNNLFFDSNDNIISKEELYKKISNLGEAFIKPTNMFDSGYAKNCKLINIIDGIDLYSRKGIKDIIKKYYSHDFIIQEKIVCHKSISDIYPNAVNTFSIYTFIWNGEIKTIDKPILKIGMNGSSTDYSGIQGNGLIIAINDDGILFDSALCIKQSKWYSHHPNTKVLFKNHKIENFQKVLETAKKLHSYVPWLGFCRWDITIGVDGEPILIELENPAELLQQQILHKEGFFGKYTEEILLYLKKDMK